VGRQPTLLVVEGYMDVVALAQYGLRNTVATLGTATTGHQAEALFRAADTVIFCFDGDEAGRKAAWRALESTVPRLREGRQARFLFLPEGEDPDSLVRSRGEEAFTALLEDATPLSDFLFDHYTAEVDMGSIDGRARLVELVRPQLDAMPEGVFRDMMTERLETLAQHRISGPVLPRANLSDGAPRRRPAQQRTPMRLALAYLVQNPELGETVGEVDEFAGCDLGGIDIFLKLVEFCAARPNVSTAQLLETWPDDSSRTHLAKLASWDLPGEAEMQAIEFNDAVTKLRLSWLERLLDAMPRITEQSPAERERQRALSQRQHELRERLRGHED